MKVLLNLELEEHQIEQIRGVADAVELVQPATGAEVMAAMSEVEVVFGDFCPAMFEAAAKLRWVQSTGAGVDGLLDPAFVASDVVLTSAKGTVGIHLADHAMALLLGLTRGIWWALRRPNWDQRFPIRQVSGELDGRILGIVGLGGTGRDLAARAAGFGMRIVAVDPEPVQRPPEVKACWGLERLGDLLRQADVVAICAPLTGQTEGMFDRAAFRTMQEHALLINVTRGRIVEEEALMEALEQGWIGGAGLDVTPREPLPADHPLWHMDNVIITPHTAGGSPRRQDRIVGIFCDNLRRFLAGESLSGVIDKSKGY